MITHPLTGDPHQDPEQVRKFFDQWGIYQKVVAHNYLHHREAYAAIAAILDRVETPFSFLDLGAGDAKWTSGVLAGRALRAYEAVDISAVALGLAEKNLEGFTGAKTFTQGDFFQDVRERRGRWDVVFIGLSLHHLPRADKARFFPAVREILPPGGRLVFYEPVCDPGESRDEVLERWWRTARHWTALEPAELQAGKDHVFSSDYQETPETYDALARAAGFTGAALRYRDEDRLYAVFECEAAG
jgi:SAM-dependent methyltransferase